jgi:hypothetical protein
MQHQRAKGCRSPNDRVNCLSAVGLTAGSDDSDGGSGKSVQESCESRPVNLAIGVDEEEQGR